MAEQLKRGPHAVIECTEEIPCNPCCTACPQGAITMAEGLSSLPCLNRGKCTGCGLCIPCCPGQAILVIDDTYSGSEGLLSLPYEFTPLPIVGQSVILTDRRGRPVGEGTIHRVLCPPVFHQTAVVTLRVPLALLDTVRGFLPTSGKEVLHEG